MPGSDYTTQALVDRVTLKAFVSSSSSLTSQQILDLANDSLRSYVVPVMESLREEFWVTADDIVLTSDSNGEVTVPDTVASTLRTVAWNNAGIITPLTRIEPELSFQYLAMGGNLPLGYQLRGYRMQLLPKVPGISMHLTAMERPAQMVLTDNAGEIASAAGAALTLESVPLAWQDTAPTEVDVISDVSPFSKVGTFSVSSLVGSVLTLTEDPETDSGWVSDVGTSPFANVPVELYPLLEQDTIVQLWGALGDKRLAAGQKRRDELELQAKRLMGPRTTGNARVITNPSAPGMRTLFGWFPRR